MAPIPFKKQPLVYTDQLRLLESRGLIINNPQKAEHILSTVSYYRMSGYWYPMLASPKDRHRFKPGSTFDNAFNLYCFDKDLRHLIAAELEKIEVAVRAKMSYVLSHAHGPFWFSKREIFKKQEVPDPLPENWKSKFDSSLEKLTEEYNRSKEEFIIAFKKKYSDPLPPCWTLL